MTGEGKVKMVVKGDHDLDCKIFKFENPLRLAMDFKNVSVEDGLLPRVVASPPVLQVVQTPFGDKNQHSRLELVLSENAAYELTERGNSITLDVAVNDETVPVQGLARQGNDTPVISIDGSIEDMADALAEFEPAAMIITGEEAAMLAQAEGSDTLPDLSGFEVVEAPPVDDTETTATETQSSLTGLPDSLTGSTLDEDRSGADWSTYTQGGDATGIGGTTGRYTGERITLTLRDASIQDVLQEIAAITGFNIVLDPGVQGTVTIYLVDVPWDQALDIILRNNSLGRTIEGNVMRVAPLEKLKQEERELFELQEARKATEPLYTEVIYISYADAQELGDILRGNLTPRGVMEIDDRTNAMVVTDLRQTVERLKRYIAILDRRTQQVSVNARIVNASKTFTRNLGLSYSFSYFGDAAHGTNTRFNFPYNYAVASAVNLPGPSVPQVANLSFGDILDSTFLELALSAAESEGTGKVIANPKIITSDNEAASIRSGIQVPYILAQGDIQLPTDGGTVDAGETQLIQFQDAEVAMDVTPQVTNDRYIDLTVEITNNSLGSGSPPSINTQSASSKVLIKDGDTFVVGGFKQINMNSGEDRIPGIHKIPILGWFFKSESKSQTLSDLLIFITPSILQDEGVTFQTATPDERSQGDS